MVALLTPLHHLELPAPALRPDVGAAAAAAAGSPVLVQHRALLYGTLAVVADVAISAWAAVVAAGAAAVVLQGQQRRGSRPGVPEAQAQAAGRDAEPGEGMRSYVAPRMASGPLEVGKAAAAAPVRLLRGAP